MVRYDLNARDTALFKRGLERLAEIYWAAGAREVTVPCAGFPCCATETRARCGARECAAATCTRWPSTRWAARARAIDPAVSVVDGEGAVHGVDGLHVADASVIPGSPGVNPQITIMALASRTAFSLLGQSAPLDEPEPEHIAQVRSARLPAVA